MPVSEKKIQLSGPDGQRLPFSNSNTAQSRVTASLLCRGIDAFPVTIVFEQSNFPNKIDKDTNLLIEENKMSPIVECGTEEPVAVEVSDNGNFHLILDTFSAKYGNAVVLSGAAIEGTVEILVATPVTPN